MDWDDRPRRGRRGGAGGFDKIPEFDIGKLRPPEFKPRHLLLIIPIIIAIWLLTGLYKVELQEEAVALAFGKHIKTSQPGLHWNVPSPFGKVIKVKSQEIKRVEIGFRTGQSRISRNELMRESLMLTEGANMIDIHMSVQYQVSDSAMFLFEVADTPRKLEGIGPEITVKNVAEAALREIVGKNNIDEILTVGKAQVQQDIHDLMQTILDRYNAGVSIRLVQLQDVHPPDEVREAFRDVNNSEEDKNRLIREAEGYYNSIIPETRGRAAQIIARAEAYKEEKVKISEGDASRFLSQLKEYKNAPEITKKRLYIEAMEEVLSKVDKVIIDKNVSGSVLPLLPLGNMKQTPPVLQGEAK